MFKLFRVIWNLRDLDENVHVIKCRFHYVIELLERIETIMANTNETIKALLEKQTALEKQLDKVGQEIEANADSVDAGLLQQLKDGQDRIAEKVQNLDDRNPDAAADTPAAGEGQDTLDAGAGADVPATPETPEGQVADQA